MPQPDPRKERVLIVALIVCTVIHVALLIAMMVG